MTKKQSHLIDMLKQLGHTNIRVQWKPVTTPMEMCGPGGGWIAETDQVGVEPLGLNYKQAIEHIQEASWLKF